MTHELKCWSEYYEAILESRKTFEVRKDDRGYSVGDSLLLREFDPGIMLYSGRQMLKNVSYILRGPDFGVQAGYCIMALAESRVEEKLKTARVTIKVLVKAGLFDGPLPKSVLDLADRTLAAIGEI